MISRNSPNLQSPLPPPYHEASIGRPLPQHWHAAPQRYQLPASSHSLPLPSTRQSRDDGKSMMFGIPRDVPRPAAAEPILVTDMIDNSIIMNQTITAGGGDGATINYSDSLCKCKECTSPLPPPSQLQLQPQFRPLFVPSQQQQQQFRQPQLGPIIESIPIRLGHPSPRPLQQQQLHRPSPLPLESNQRPLPPTNNEQHKFFQLNAKLAPIHPPLTSPNMIDFNRPVVENSQPRSQSQSPLPPPQSHQSKKNNRIENYLQKNEISMFSRELIAEYMPDLNGVTILNKTEQSIDETAASYLNESADISFGKTLMPTHFDRKPFRKFEETSTYGKAMMNLSEPPSASSKSPSPLHMSSAPLHPLQFSNNYRQQPSYDIFRYRYTRPVTASSGDAYLAEDRSNDVQDDDEDRWSFSQYSIASNNTLEPMTEFFEGSKPMLSPPLTSSTAADVRKGTQYQENNIDDGIMNGMQQLINVDEVKSHPKLL